MDKIKTVLFWILVIIYEEIAFSCLIFNQFPINFLFIILFSIPLGLGLNIITSIFSKKINMIISYIILLIIFFTLSAQIVYYSMYEAIISFFSFVNSGQVLEFMDTIVDMVLKNWYGILIFFAPIVILIFLSIRKKIAFKRIVLKEFLIKFITLIIIQALAIIGIDFIKTESIYSNKNLYYNLHIPKLTVNRMGLFTAMRLDLQRFIFGFEEKLAIQTNSTVYEENKKYNMVEIDFDELIANEGNNTIKNMHEYFSNELPTLQNEYTGMFEGKNLVVFVAEAFSSLAIREDLTPTLYKLYNEGFQFDNFYTPVFPVSTADGEYITDTSLIPKEGVWSLYRINGNYMPYSYANVFEKLGYSSNAYHNHTATYYHRDDYIKTMGYDSYLAVGNGLEKRMNCRLWPNSDYEMVNVTVSDYIDNANFISYYMTVSGHMNYTTTGNCMASRNWNKVKDLQYSHKAKSYLATQIELDKAIAELIKQLEEAGKLQNTVIAISADHYPYGLTMNEINEISTYERDDTFEKYRMPFLIWNSEMPEPVKVEKIGSSLDVLPTLLNLFGVEYDSRLLIGKDILSDAEPLVIFSDRSFITDKGKYSSVTGKFTPSEGIEVNKNYIEQINSQIYQKYQMSRLILENDYYRILWNELGWEIN